MIISTRGKYALRIMIDLAETGGTGYTALKSIAERQQISHKYAEAIMSVLAKAELVDSVHGKGGGYRLNRKPEDYSVGEILRLTEGSLTPVSCQGFDDAEPCERAGECRTFPMWEKLNRMIQDYIDSVSVADLMKE